MVGAGGVARSTKACMHARTNTIRIVFNPGSRLRGPDLVRGISIQKYEPMMNGCMHVFLEVLQPFFGATDIPKQMR